MSAYRLAAPRVPDPPSKPKRRFRRPSGFELAAWVPAAGLGLLTGWAFSPPHGLLDGVLWVTACYLSYVMAGGRRKGPGRLP
jgi:hypothetical protein